MSRLRVLLADDHRILAEGLKSLLVSEFDVVDLVEDGRAMIAAAKALQGFMTARRRAEHSHIVLGTAPQKGHQALLRLPRQRLHQRRALGLSCVPEGLGIAALGKLPGQLGQSRAGPARKP